MDHGEHTLFKVKACFSVSGLMLKTSIHLDLSFVHGENYESICILHAYTQLYQHYLLKMLSFSHCIIFGFRVENQLSLGVWIYIWFFDLNL